MKKILCLTALVALSSCGSEENKAATQPVLDGNAPNVQVPADAVASDYSCEEVREFTNVSGFQSKTYPTQGVTHDWKEGDTYVSYDVDADGLSQGLMKYRRTDLSNGQYRSEGKSTAWTKENDRWGKETIAFDRVWQKAGNIRRIVSNKVNGEEKPYQWAVETIVLDERRTKTIQRHTNPSERNSDDRKYSKIEITCTYTDR